MGSEYLQRIRHKLVKRMGNLTSAQDVLFHYFLRLLWHFLHENMTIAGILEELRLHHPDAERDATKITVEGQPVSSDNENEQVALSYFVIKHCVTENDPHGEELVGVYYGAGDGLQTFRHLFLEPLFDYISDKLDDELQVLTVLTRYKQRSEWFERDALYKLCMDNSKEGEDRLASSLYEYLHDQGLDFVIQPYSVSGRVDLIADQKGDKPLILDAKLFDPDKSHGKPYIAHGFHQVYTYTRDHNQSFGYLAIFKTCKDDIKLALANETRSTHYVKYNNKTIFIMVIDLFPYDQPASKRGYLKTWEITEDDLIRSIIEGDKASVP